MPPTAMHCPNCRHQNATTTRFCTSCGAVLVESTPQGGRRRVLRPWGLGRSAPLTESPAMPELADARRAEQRATAPRRRRVDVMVVCGFAFVAAAGVVAYPFSSTDELRPSREAGDRAAPRLDVVAVPGLSTVRETQLAAPALIESPVMPYVARSSSRVVAPMADPASRPSPSPKTLTPATESPVPPAPEPAVVTPAAEPATPVVAAPVDRWAPLRQALSSCAAVDGLLQRAMCDQQARLANCEGHWGLVSLCPAGRTEYGQ